jgi:uncharacterized protein YjaZ
MGPIQKFTVLPAYEDALRYVEAVQSDPQADRKAAYERIVVQPYWDRFVSGGEFERNLPKEKLTQPPEDMHALAESVTSIRDSDIESMTVGTLQKLSRVLAGPDTTVCIFPADPADPFVKEYMQGVLGAVVGAGRIALQISPCAGWLDRIPAAIAHEYHHSVWLHLKWKEISSFDLLNYVIFEGRGCFFSRMLFPSTPAPWTKALTPQQEAEQWKNMRDHLAEDSYEEQIRFMFGGGTVPLCAGYTVGFHIVQSFLQRNPQMTVSEWTVVDAQDLLDRSHYDPG